MKKTGFLYDERFLNHETGLMHPESADRLRVVMSQLKETGLIEKLRLITAEFAETRWLELVHGKDYIERLKTHCLSDETTFDFSDNRTCSETFNTASLAVGGILKTIRMVMDGELDNAFCAVRPPGHHAESGRAMGFCYFANVAIAAKYIQANWNIRRIAIIDFDVHHGNGTQRVFESDPSVFYYSVHEHPSFSFPGTGRIFEKGTGPGKGFTRNYALLPGQGDKEYMKLMEVDLIPVIDQYQPEIILLSTGFDAHYDDIMSRIKMTTKGFSIFMERIMELAQRNCQGRLISVLEGGYSLLRLPELVSNHLKILLGEPPDDYPEDL
ncbi:MAG: histone deacetylase [Proteobacteria bacterium]|nr:histone deacetylase [Pseudomonadota bacterium]MBU4469599.1 histone deacetylase [Pseudomonadota bacterium]MCG2753277.1 histone deacetylase [Desulfobacteraceae bacterium]